MSESLQQLDIHIAALRQALEDQDWDQLTDLNARTNDHIEPVMQDLEAGQLSPTLVQQRLESLSAFCDQAEAQAREARQEARQALEEVSRNRQAARAYGDVLARRPK